MTLAIAPMTLRAANRHALRLEQRRPRADSRSMFAIALSKGEETVGVVVVAEPLLVRLRDNATAQIARLCTDGSAGMAEVLCDAAWVWAEALGIGRLVAYGLPEECWGGWVCMTDPDETEAAEVAVGAQGAGPPVQQLGVRDVRGESSVRCR